MHELSIANSLVEIVTDSLPSQTKTQVSSIQLKIGALSCVHPDALAFSFELVSRDTPLATAKLEIEVVPVSIYCSLCDSVETLEGIQIFRCPRCETPSSDIRSGRELSVESFEIEDEGSLYA